MTAAHRMSAIETYPSGVSADIASAHKTAGSTMSPHHRVTIYCHDDAVRERIQATMQQLLTSAARADHDTSDTSPVLAKKALQYRKIYSRMAIADVTSPQFDAFAFLGIQWCRAPSHHERKYQRTLLV